MAYRDKFLSTAIGWRQTMFVLSVILVLEAHSTSGYKPFQPKRYLL